MNNKKALEILADSKQQLAQHLAMMGQPEYDTWDRYDTGDMEICYFVEKGQVLLDVTRDKGSNMSVWIYNGVLTAFTPGAGVKKLNVGEGQRLVVF